MPRISSNDQDTPNDEHAFDSGGERHPVDVQVGSRIRLRRLSAGMSEEELSATLGVTVEKMREYESGTTRMAAGLLYEVSKQLECPPTVFFEDM
jgi:ribosome-binding protein aMBF1 (putative translation factor)